ncbi:MAG: SH3 domain-containing protein [Christensenellales bacterium]|jgi:hypothetical protein
MKTKRLLAVFLALVLSFAVAAPAALAADIIPITSDRDIIIALHSASVATIRPVNPSQLGYYSLTYEITGGTGYGMITYTTESVVYNGVTYPNVPVAKVTGLQAGTLVITAKQGALPVGTTTITVRSPLASGNTTISAGTTLLSYGQSTQLTSSSGFPLATCVSSDPTYFSVTNSGLVTCKVPAGSAGYADIDVYDAGGYYGKIRIFGGTYPTSTVLATKNHIAINESVQLYLDGTPDHCGSSNPAVATVTENGIIKGISNGVATIYCINSAKKSTGQYTITVGTGAASGGQVSLLKNTIAVGESTLINAVGMTVASTISSNPAVASVNGSIVTGVSAGTANITYITSTGATGTLPITVTAGTSTTDPNLPQPTKSYTFTVGSSKTFKYSSASVAEAWTADPSIVSATLVTGSNGYKQARFTALSAGTTTAYLKTASGTISALTFVITEGDVTGKTGKINSGDDDLRVSVRKGPGSSYGRLATMSNGIKVTIDGESGSYYKIKFTSSGKTYTGYVKKAFITF